MCKEDSNEIVGLINHEYLSDCFPAYWELFDYDQNDIEHNEDDYITIISNTKLKGKINDFIKTFKVTLSYRCIDSTNENTFTTTLSGIDFTFYDNKDKNYDDEDEDNENYDDEDEDNENYNEDEKISLTSLQKLQFLKQCLLIDLKSAEKLQEKLQNDYKKLIIVERIKECGNALIVSDLGITHNNLKVNFIILPEEKYKFEDIQWWSDDPFDPNIKHAEQFSLTEEELKSAFNKLVDEYV